MGCCHHEDKSEEKKAEGCCGGHGHDHDHHGHGHEHGHAKTESGMKWWKRLIPGMQKKSCCGGSKGGCH